MGNIYPLGPVPIAQRSLFLGSMSRINHLCHGIYLLICWPRLICLREPINTSTDNTWINDHIATQCNTIQPYTSTNNKTRMIPTNRILTECTKTQKKHQARFHLHKVQNREKGIYSMERCLRRKSNCKEKQRNMYHKCQDSNYLQKRRQGIVIWGEGQMESFWGTGNGHGNIFSLSDFNRFSF